MKKGVTPDEFCPRCGNPPARCTRKFLPLFTLDGRLTKAQREEVNAALNALNRAADEIFCGATLEEAMCVLRVHHDRFRAWHAAATSGGYQGLVELVKQQPIESYYTQLYDQRN